MTMVHANADGLSQLPLPHTTQEGHAAEATIFQIAQLDTLPVTQAQIQHGTNRDPILSKFLSYTRQNWPNEVPPELTAYSNKRNKLSLEGNCLLRGIHVVVPNALQGDVLQELHRSHLGMNQMKRIAHSYVWWPRIDL